MFKNLAVYILAHLSIHITILTGFSTHPPTTNLTTNTIHSLDQVLETPTPSNSCTFGCCDCLEESLDGGCNASASCTAAVKMVNDSMCEFEWDLICVAIANYYCQSDSLNDPNQCCGCLNTNDAPGCSANAACQLQVCDWDDYCCYTEWDGFCVDRAQKYCTDQADLETSFSFNTSTTSTSSPVILPYLHSTCHPTSEPTYEPTTVSLADPSDHPTADSTIVITSTTDTTSTSTTTRALTAESSFFISLDNPSQNFILFGVLAVASCCLLTICCVIILIHKKLSNKSAIDLAQIQIAKDENQIIMSNGLIVNIVIGKYDDGANQDSNHLEVDSVINDMKQFANDFGYQYMSMNDKRYWTEQEILSFLRDDVGTEFFDEFSTPKYDGLTVAITSYGNERDIISSDGEVMDKVAIQRVISNQYAAIRDFPRIFVFDLCDAHQLLKISISTTVQHMVMGIASIDLNSQSDFSFPAAVEMKQDETLDISKNTDFEDVRQINEWTHDTKNPDYNLVTIDAVGELSASNVVHYFTERVRLNVENQEGLGLTDVMDNIRTDLRQRGRQLCSRAQQ